MASFTDNPQLLGNFNPYIQTLPVEDMAKVGMIKQEQFDRGVEKVQSYVDTLSGLPIAKDEVKSYVQTKLGQLREGVTKNLAGDFSDQRIVNQIGGAARIIAKDPIVQNGVTSTARMQTALSDLQEAKKAGKSSPQNEAFLQDNVSKWLNDGQIDSSFSGSYVPYTDITDKFLKLYKDQHPGEDIPQDVYRTDSNGNTVINPVLFKGQGPAKIQALFNLVTSQPDAQQQLHIDGWYKYRGTTPNQLGQSLEQNANASLKSIEAAVQALQVKIATGSTDNTLSQQIEQLKNLAVEKKKSFDGIAGLLRTNPDAAKAELVKEEMAGNIIGAYSYTTMEKSPLWEASMQEKTFNRQYDEWQKDYDFKLNKEKWDEYMDVQKLSLEQEKLSKSKKGVAGAEGDIITEGPIVTSEASAYGSKKGMEDQNAALDEYTQAQMELIGRLSGGNIKDSPAILDVATGRWKFNFGPDKQYHSQEDAQDAMRVLLSQAKDKYINGQINDDRTAQLFDNVTQKQDNWQAKKQIVSDVEAQFAPQISKIRDAFKNDDYASAFIVMQGLPGKEEALRNLQSKYGAGVDPDTGTPAWKTKLGLAQPSDPQGVTGKINEEHGPKYDEYNKIAKTLSNNQELALALAQREEEYKKRQSTTIPYVITSDVAKPEERNYVNSQFNALASSLALNPSTGKGDINKLLGLTDQHAKDFTANQYRHGIDPQTGRAFISIQQGNDEPVTVEITRAAYEKMWPATVYNNEFREKYGPRFDQTQQTSTDPLGENNGGGRANAYIAKQPKDSPYIVQYHLIKEGAGSYNIKWWVSAKASPNTPIINGENASGTVVGMPTSLSEEEVVKWTQKFQDKNWLDQVLQLKSLQK